MTYQECIKLEDLVPKQVWNEIMANYDWKKHPFKEGKMKYQLKRNRMTSFTAEDAEVNQDAIDQMIATEIISEIVDATNKVFNAHLEKHGISATSIRSDSIVADVRKWLYDDLKPLVEPKMKEETKMSIQDNYICTPDYNCYIVLDRISGVCDQVPTYEFHGETTDIDKLLSQIKKRPNMPIANRIWQNDGRHTTVEWRDGTKTTVCCEDPEKYTEWGGFCACVTKKLYGSATKAEFELETAKKTTAWPAKKKELERKKLKALKQRAAQRKKEQREQKIADKMEEMRITNEAGHRLAKEHSEKETAVAVEEG